MVARHKRVGMVGGTSWESTAEYYRLINQRSREMLGGAHTLELLLWSLNFGEVLELKARRDPALDRVFMTAVRGLVSLGAELLVICSNTGHQRAEEAEAAAGIPLVHIADACGAEIRRRDMARVGLLGTLETMQSDFYKRRLETFGIEVIVPQRRHQDRVHEIAIDEISRGIRSDVSRKELVQIIEDLSAEGAQGVILGCTELPLLISPSDIPVPTYDTLGLHVDAIVEQALA